MGVLEQIAKVVGLLIILLIVGNALLGQDGAIPNLGASLLLIGWNLNKG